MAVSVYRLFGARPWKPAGSGFRSLERGAIAVHLQSDGIVRVAQLSTGAAVEPRQVAGKNVLHFASPIFANTKIHVRFASASLCRLHVSFSSGYDARKARRLPIGRGGTYMPVLKEMSQLKLT